MIRTAAAQLIAATEASLTQHEAESADGTLDAVQRSAATKKAVHQANLRLDVPEVPPEVPPLPPEVPPAPPAPEVPPREARIF